MKYTLTTTLFLLFTFQTFALEFEINLKGAWGKRVRDEFDLRWDTIIADSANIGATTATKKVTFLRNTVNSQIEALLSPFYKHYMGLNFAFLASPGSISLQKTINSADSHTWNMNFLLFSPGVTYKFYPFIAPKDKVKFYVGIDIGFVLGSVNLTHAFSGSSSSYTEKVSLNRVSGPRVQTKVGFKFPAFWKVDFYAETGVDIMRLDDLEGTISGGPNSSESASLKIQSKQLILSKTSTDSNFSSASSQVIWINQIFFAAGLSLVF